MRRFVGLLGVSVGLAGAATAAAGTHVVTFGGGPPTHNQISLEKNVEYFRRVLAGVGLGGVRHDVYFGDGGARNSVQYRMADGDEQRFTKALGLILASSPDADMRYARVRLPDLVGPSSVDNVEAWFGAVGGSLPPGERLVFYFTGHGGPDPANREAPRNTTLVMPGDRPSLAMKDFAAQLDKVGPDVEVTLVMVQCYSGGFANVIYNEGDPAKGFAKHPRAGFFSTVASRTAAGCTPDIAEEDYHEFSTSFFEALLGEGRTGKPVAKPDFDGDGRTSFDEAYAHVLLTSNTVDLPVTTSDQLLRDKSRFARPDDDPSRGLIVQDAPWSVVLAAASPSQRAALEGLSRALNLDGEDRLARARKRAKELDPRRNSGGPRRGGPNNNAGAQQGPQAQQGRPQQGPAPGSRPTPIPGVSRLRTVLGDRWPELTVPLHPDASRILVEERAAIRSLLESQAEFKPLMDRLARRPVDAAAQANSPERQWVKYQRLLDRADSVVLGANLPALADPDALGVYRRLIELEGRTLAPQRP